MSKASDPSLWGPTRASLAGRRSLTPRLDAKSLWATGGGIGGALEHQVSSGSLGPGHGDSTEPSRLHEIGNKEKACLFQKARLRWPHRVRAEIGVQLSRPQGLGPEGAAKRPREASAGRSTLAVAAPEVGRKIRYNPLKSLISRKENNARNGLRLRFSPAFSR
jgi:hypothetical protein